MSSYRPCPPAPGPLEDYAVQLEVAPFVWTETGKA